MTAQSPSLRLVVLDAGVPIGTVAVDHTQDTVFYNDRARWITWRVEQQQADGAWLTLFSNLEPRAVPTGHITFLGVLP